MFFTYMFIRQADGTPYYIGKGSGYRAYTTAHRYVKAPRNGKRLDRARILVQDWPDEATAFEMEKYYIRLFGRKDNGTGILRNLTDGGEGQSRSSISWTPERRQRNLEHLKHICRLGGLACRGNFTKAQRQSRISNIAKARTTLNALPAEILTARRSKGGRAGGHVRWHVNRGVKVQECQLCNCSAGNSSSLII